MAIKEKNTQKQSKLLEVLMTEYKWENLLLGILATLSAALALIIIIGKGPLTISPEFPILGTGNNGLIFAWILFIISIFGLFLVIYPFFLPALPEIRKISWATKKQFLQDAARVIIFTLVVTGFIFAFDLIATQLIGLLGAN